MTVLKEFLVHDICEKKLLPLSSYNYYVRKNLSRSL